MLKVLLVVTVVSWYRRQMITNGNALPATDCNCLQLPVTACDCLQLSVAACNCLSLPATACRCLQLPVAACNCLSLPATACRCLQLPVAACNCLSLPATACRCLQLPGAFEDGRWQKAIAGTVRPYGNQALSVKCSQRDGGSSFSDEKLEK